MDYLLQTVCLYFNFQLFYINEINILLNSLIRGGMTIINNVYLILEFLNYSKVRTISTEMLFFGVCLFIYILKYINSNEQIYKSTRNYIC